MDNHTLDFTKPFEITPDLIQGLTDKQCEVRGVLIAEQIDLKVLGGRQRVKKAPLMLNLSSTSIVVIFRYGALVFFNTNPDDQADFIDCIREVTKSPYPTQETEAMPFRINPNIPEGIQEKCIFLKQVTKERILLIADAIAKSVVLDKQETQVAHSFERVEPIARNLVDKGRLTHSISDLLRFIGHTLLTEQALTAKVEMDDKPEVLWDNPDLEPLHLKLVEEFEIKDRQVIVNKKLDLISRTARTSLDVLQHRHGLRVEWYIIILIVVEILLELYFILAMPQGMH